ncbi:SsgA family sporulation/cell division regulator [Amycolatopsis nigrescens]|uniref:SsgA family sporulation/cell division regulator n=1 Tax=Amycolatopsis nigrescens TaxID=381445 RepID=UPI0003626C1A|nr:SsgA family sporulation/cell division regulator [Amycolatopsis nigrescens]
MSNEHGTIHTMVTFALRTFGAGPLPVRVGLSYHPQDPYAVALAFHAGPGVVDWIVARDLLADGLLAATGDGDLRVSPAADPSLVLVELSTPDGAGVFEAPAQELAAFLDRTYDLVGAGEEHEWFDFDHELTKLAARD